MSSRSVYELAPLWEELEFQDRYEFLYGGKVQFRAWHENLDQTYLGMDNDIIWEEADINRWAVMCVFGCDVRFLACVCLGCWAP
jgi:hypothetical protein